MTALQTGFDADISHDVGNGLKSAWWELGFGDVFYNKEFHSTAAGALLSSEDVVYIVHLDLKTVVSRGYAAGTSFVFDDVTLRVAYDVDEKDHSAWTTVVYDFAEGGYHASNTVTGNDGATQGGVLNGTGNNPVTVPAGGTGEYWDEESFIGFITSGFGIWGNNGLFAMLGEFFSFLPEPIIKVITTGTALTFVAIIYRLLRG